MKAAPERQVLAPVPASEPELVLGAFISERIDATGDCWLWSGTHNSDGYGSTRLGHRGCGARSMAAHRAIYQLLVGSVPADMHLDHLCRNKNCVNPDHLEVVTRRENILRGYSPQAMNARQTHCRRAGHPLSGDNVRIYRGLRACRACTNGSYSRRTAAAV